MSNSHPHKLTKSPPNSAQALEDHIVNGDFEYPATSQFTNFTGDWFRVDPTTSTGQYYDPPNQRWTDISDWDATKFVWLSNQTRPIKPDRNSTVEIQIDVNTKNHYGELVGTQARTSIYQDVTTIPGAVYRWSLKQTSLNSGHLDTMSVLIGAVNATGAAQMATRTTVNGNGDKVGVVGAEFGTNATNSKNRDHSKQWETYTGTYLVPAGQTQTRFSFESISAVGTDGGNLLDDISFAQAYPLFYKANYPTGSTGSGSVPFTGLNTTTGIYDNYFLTTEDAALSAASSTDLAAQDAAGENYVLVGWSKTKHTLCTTAKQVKDAGAITTYGNVAASGADNQVYAIWATSEAVATYNLSIDKTATGNVPTGSTFNYSVGLTYDDGTPISGTYDYAIANGGAQTGTGTITLDANGTASISGVKSGDTVTIKGVPSGTLWSVDEENWTLAGDTASLAGTWSTTWSSSSETGTPTNNGTAASGTLSANATVSYTNTNPATASLTITKAVRGNAAPDGSSFSFGIVMKDKDGNPLTGGYSYIKPDGTSGTLAFTAEGKATVGGVTGGQSITIQGLPYNSTYTVTEADPGTGWSTTHTRARSVVLRDNAYTSSATGGYYTWPTALTAYLPSTAGSAGSVLDLPSIPAGSTVAIKQTSTKQASPNPGSDKDVDTATASALYTTSINANGELNLVAGNLWSAASGAFSPTLGQYYIYLTYNYPVIGDDAGETGASATGTITTDESVSFTNTYQSTTWTPGVTKKLTTGSDTVTTAPDFTFSIAQDANSPADTPMPGKISATAAGLTTATFGSITYNKAGIYIYDITETKGSAGGWTYDGDTIKATVVVSADSNTGALSTAVTYDKAGTPIAAPAFSNKFKQGSTTLVVTTVWVDNSNAENTRPADDATYQNLLGLYTADGTKVVATPTIVRNHDNTWTVTYTGLPSYTSDGSTISYYVTQGTVDEYKAPVYSGDGHALDGGTITNTQASPATVDISGSKAWDDFSNVEKTRPASVTLTLANDCGLSTDGYAPVWTNTEGNTWTWTYTGLPKFDTTGATVTWSVTEAQVTGYDAPDYGVGKASAVNGDTITNKLTNRYDDVSFTATIDWDDFSNVDGVRPSADQIKTALTFTANATTATYVPTVVDNGDNTYTVTYTGLPTYADDGSTVSYMLTQSQIADYDAPTFSSGGANVATGGTITNKLENRHQDATLTFTKAWDDSSNASGTRPSISDFAAYLTLSDGSAIVSAKPMITDNGNDTFTISYSKLPRYDAAGKTFAYSVKEAQVTGYKVPNYSGGATFVADGGTISNVIIATPETPTNPTGGTATAGTAAANAPATGDAVGIMLPLLAGGMGLVLLLLAIRRRSRER